MSLEGTSATWFDENMSIIMGYFFSSEGATDPTIMSHNHLSTLYHNMSSFSPSDHDLGEKSKFRVC